MGLAAPRKRTKISQDPNNTNWSRSTTGFGHKILSSQGWTPGTYLGARDAAHADMFTAASASHIRVIMKDDTLGLGARSKRAALDEPTGLDAFKGLLGRLNGKSDAELQVDQRKRDDVKLARYAANKWQTVRFISAGLLAQEKDEESQKPPAGTRSSSPRTSKEDEGRKLSATEETGTSNETEGSESRKRGDKKSKKEKKDKKEKREKRDKKRKRAERQEGAESSQESSSTELYIGANKTELALKVPPARECRPLGRHMIRGRHIAQKRKALMDEKSLNEVNPFPRRFVSERL
ncbi:Putative Protein pxr1 [Aspergillus calidoustus]|uniref:Protein PXR1 n=1 Tax=Aspergillus calidoustus TaxID=454130 RepID=A0A0U5HFM7_ASPCI|nr:Putative Protein pxr1 [Aspergillus calidoustus]